MVSSVMLGQWKEPTAPTLTTNLILERSCSLTLNDAYIRRTTSPSVDYHRALAGFQNISVDAVRLSSPVRLPPLLAISASGAVPSMIKKRLLWWFCEWTVLTRMARFLSDGLIMPVLLFMAAFIESRGLGTTISQCTSDISYRFRNKRFHNGGARSRETCRTLCIGNIVS